MPELPEVQTTVNDLLQTTLFNKKIKTITVNWPRTILPEDPKSFKTKLKSLEFKTATRRGKWIIFDLNNDYKLFIHLRMSGRLKYVKKNIEKSKHEQVIFHLENGYELRFFDIRKFGRIRYEKDLSILDSLGPEPLSKSFNNQVLSKILSKTAKKIKQALLDQTKIAGLGNIYADESLWYAKISPHRPANKIDKNEVSELCKAIKKSLNIGLKNLGTSLGSTEINYYSVSGRQGRNQDRLKAYRRTGLDCPRKMCKGKIQKTVIQTRSTHYCSICQT